MENNFNINDIQEVMAERLKKDEQFLETAAKVAVITGGGKLSATQVAHEITKETLADSVEFVGGELIDENFNVHVVHRTLDEVLAEATRVPAEAIAEGTHLGSVYPTGLLRESRAINPSTGMRSAVMSGSISVETLDNIQEQLLESIPAEATLKGYNTSKK